MVQEIGYINYFIFLLLLTGGYNFIFVTKKYGLGDMRKEKNTAQFVGLLNILLAVFIFVGKWAYQKWFW